MGGIRDGYPDIALWRQIRVALNAPDGDTVLRADQRLVDSAAGRSRLHHVQGQNGLPPSPKELLLNVDNAAGDPTLKFENPLKGMPLDPRRVQFQGRGRVFRERTLHADLTADKEYVDGIPATAFSGLLLRQHPDAASRPRKRSSGAGWQPAADVNRPM